MIEVTDLKYAYGGGEPILRNLSFEIGAGEKVVLLGTNGSGKTTLLKILNGLIIATEGSYRYRSEEMTGKTLRGGSFHRRFRKEVVLLFQNEDTMIFNPTVYDEIAFGPRQLSVNDLDRRVRRYADLLGVTGLLNRPPFSLSSGEKKKVCLASLLIMEPEVLLLDEPVSNLDPRSAGWLVDFLHDLDMTTVVTTHNLSLAAELGDRSLVLSEKHDLIYDGRTVDLLADKEKLLEANLVRAHRHGEVEHRHYHTHDRE